MEKIWKKLIFVNETETYYYDNLLDSALALSRDFQTFMCHKFVR